MCGLGFVSFTDRVTMDFMDVKLWVKLPSEILERTLSFLAPPELCRFRTVCKRWNYLICTPEFRFLCMQNARQDGCFLVARYMIRGEGEQDPYADGHFDKNHGWSFLDLNSRRWHTIKQDGHDVFDYFNIASDVAMDGGLVCQILDTEYGYMSALPDILVSNPIARVSRILPPPPCPCYTDTSKLNIVVNNPGRNFKVLVIPNSLDLKTAGSPFLVVYDSASDQWRCSSFPSMPQMSNPHISIDVQCSVFLGDETLYVLTSAGVEFAEEFLLWSYNHVEDTWIDTGVSITGMELIYPQLIVSCNQLFLASWWRTSHALWLPSGDAASQWSYEIRKINLEDKTLTRVFNMTGEIMAHIFEMPAQGLDQGWDSALHQGLLAHAFGLTAFGIGKFIVLICEPDMGQYNSGVAIVYDRSTSSWDLLPKNPLIPFNFESGLHKLWYRKPMNLFLPVNRLW
ncbi:hypothetical protein KC19_7G105600 [Ceratodon purpureus]|uniref:F-box domain-containing protein n=1 Tax=Ceratodon purpureus TaxID=3225 RepID=A0A8T0HA38_CERPU|nr:hypothetical protein KC19_7G105600 [Ceratodon purpureus]